MISRLRRFGCAFARDERGTSLVEFTLVAPFLGLLTVGIADYSRGFAEIFALESAAYRTLERAAVGGTQTSYDYLRQEAANAAGVPLANVTLDNWLECGGTRMASYDEPCQGGQQIARYIKLTIGKTFEPSFNWTNMSGPFRIKGDAAVRVQ